jgi:hypothetical protein
MKNQIMLKYFPHFLVMLSFMSCDVPQRTRIAPSTDTLNAPTDSDVTSGNSTSSSSQDSFSYETGDLDSSSSSTTDANFPSCDLSTKYQTTDIGSFGLCQSTVDETLFKIKFTTTTTSRNCLIPTYKDSSGSSTYIGQPQCTSVTEANVAIQGQLYKNRSGYESYPLNGVMVMKESLLNGYFNCMHAYINWLPQACPNGATSSSYCYSWIYACPYGAKTNYSCDQAARSYMNEICNSFKSQYGSYYADIKTK